VIEDEEKRRWAISNLEELRDAPLELAEAEGATISSVLEAIASRIATRAPLIESDVEPRVSIMTLHSAKGARGRRIVLAGLAD
jgi:superfamily I DNA/RNA helicase